MEEHLLPLQPELTSPVEFKGTGTCMLSHQRLETDQGPDCGPFLGRAIPLDPEGTGRLPVNAALPACRLQTLQKLGLNLSIGTVRVLSIHYADATCVATDLRTMNILQQRSTFNRGKPCPDLVLNINSPRINPPPYHKLPCVMS